MPAGKKESLCPCQLRSISSVIDIDHVDCSKHQNRHQVVAKFCKDSSTSYEIFEIYLNMQLKQREKSVQTQKILNEGTRYPCSDFCQICVVQICVRTWRTNDGRLYTQKWSFLYIFAIVGTTQCLTFYFVSLHRTIVEYLNLHNFNIVSY